MSPSTEPGGSHGSLRLEVGRVDRPHGLHGDLVVTLITTEIDRVSPGSELFADGNALRVVVSSPHGHRHIVRFEGVDTREAAEALAGSVLSAEHVAGARDDADALWVHELVGAEVVDREGGFYGVVESVQANPASDLLVLDSGGIVPLTFVVGWLERPDRLEIDPPPGLVDPVRR